MPLCLELRQPLRQSSSKPTNTRNKMNEQKTVNPILSVRRERGAMNSKHTPWTLHTYPDGSCSVVADGSVLTDLNPEIDAESWERFVAEHNQAPALLAERDALRAALEQLLSAVDSIPRGQFPLQISVRDTLDARAALAQGERGQK